MADKKRLLDVWIVDLKMVYRDVPFAVVADWLQQGRLLGEDRVRPAGGPAWHQVASLPAFAAFLPRVEPLRAEDQAEALEPVEADVTWRSPSESEEEDVDMIPLIDISLVLLIFFMMTASVSSGVLSRIQTPAAKYQLLAISKDMYWVGVDPKGPQGKVEKGVEGKALPWFSLGRENKLLVPATRDSAEVAAGLEKQLEGVMGEVKVRLRADTSFPIEVIKGITLELQGVEGKINRQRDAKTKLVLSIAGEVSEPTR